METNSNPLPAGASAKEAMQTADGRAVYKMRNAVVGHIKEQRGFRRFSSRGKQNVRCEWRLVWETRDGETYETTPQCRREIQGVISPGPRNLVPETSRNAASHSGRTRQLKIGCRLTSTWNLRYSSSLALLLQLLTASVQLQILVGG